MLRAILFTGLLVAAVLLKDSCLFFTTTACFSGLEPINEGVDDSTLAADFSTSAFGLEQYTQLREPYRSYPCMPKRIHISQKGNVHIIPQPKNESHFHNQTTEYALDMTVSFSLDYEKCANATKVIINYRQGFHPEETVDVQEKPLQFSYQSSIANATLFQSDWIYHITVPNLKAGGHQYWYRIEIEGASLVSPGDKLRPVLKESRSRRLMGRTPDYSFLTAPLPHTPTSVALVGDLGQVSLNMLNQLVL
jgi:hypothetical protein